MTHPVIQTRVAQMGAQDHLFSGYQIFNELLGNESIVGLFALSVGLPKLNQEDITMLNDLSTVNMLCDPRIWPVKLSRLVASYGSALHGFCAGNLMHDNTFIGAGPCQRGAELFVELMSAIGGPEHIENTKQVEAQIKIIVSRERWPGFGVPFRVTDERMDALKKHLSDKVQSTKPFWNLLLRTEEYLLRTQRCGVNILGGICAVMLDMGFTPEQSAWMLVLIIQGNFSGAAFEGAQQKAESLQNLPLDFISYEGPLPRKSPRSHLRGKS